MDEELKSQCINLTVINNIFISDGELSFFFIWRSNNLIKCSNEIKTEEKDNAKFKQYI